MKITIQLLYITFSIFLLTFVISCSSSGYYVGTGYHHRNTWEYDRYYRSRVHHHYNRPATRENVRSKAGSRTGGAVRTRGAVRR